MKNISSKTIMNITAVCVILLAVLAAGCVQKTSSVPQDPPIVQQERFTVINEGTQVGGEGWIRVIHDNDLNVTIYQSASGYGYQSISAIPDWELQDPSMKLQDQ